jgi:hypothetical protein
MKDMAEKTKREDTTQRQSYPFYGFAPYGTSYGVPFPRVYGLPYGLPLTHFYGYGLRSGWAGLPFGVPYTEEAARKQEIRTYKTQAQYLQGVLDDINKYIEKLKAEEKE